MTNKTPKVSVIVPAYNCSKYISETLQSALRQTYKNTEIIVIDDGSTEDIEKVIVPYRKSITYIKKQNGGPASARNTGIKVSSGEYIAFLDSDDLWRPDKLAKQIAYMQRYPDIGYIHTDTQGFSSEPQQIDRYFACDLEGYVFKEQFWSNFIINSSVLVRRNCVDTIGLLDEDSKLIGSEDYDYWLRLNLHYKLGVLHEPLTLYRLRKDSLVGAERHIPSAYR